MTRGLSKLRRLLREQPLRRLPLAGTTALIVPTGRNPAYQTSSGTRASVDVSAFHEQGFTLGAGYRRMPTWHRSVTYAIRPRAVRFTGESSASSSPGTIAAVECDGTFPAHGGETLPSQRPTRRFSSKNDGARDTGFQHP